MPVRPDAAAAGIVAAVNNGSLSQERLNDAAARVLALRIAAARIVRPPLSVIDSPAHQRLAAEAASRGTGRGGFAARPAAAVRARGAARSRRRAPGSRTGRHDQAARRAADLQRDVAVRAAAGRRRGQRLGHPAPGLGRGDHLVDDAQLDRPVHPAGDLLVLARPAGRAAPRARRPGRRRACAGAGSRRRPWRPSRRSRRPARRTPRSRRATWSSSRCRPRR